MGWLVKPSAHHSFRSLVTMGVISAGTKLLTWCRGGDEIALLLQIVDPTKNPRRGYRVCNQMHHHFCSIQMTSNVYKIGWEGKTEIQQQQQLLC